MKLIPKEAEDGIRQYHLKMQRRLDEKLKPDYFDGTAFYCCVFVPFAMWFLYKHVFEII